MIISCHLPISMPAEIYGPYLDALTESYDRFKDQDTRIIIKDVPHGIKQFELVYYSGFRAANDREILKTMIAAEAEGVDAVAGACYFDSAIRAASALLSIPVVGPAEAAMSMAAMMGNHFAVVTSDALFVEEMAHHLRQLGFADKAVTHHPVRAMTLSPDELIGSLLSRQYKPIIDNFLSVARDCLKDGADVVIAGCGIVSPALTLGKIVEIDGAPIIDPMIIALKTAELFATLKKSGMRIKSVKGLYRHPPDDLKAKGIQELCLR